MATTSALLATAAWPEPRNSLNVGVQLYTLGELVQKDLDGTLAQLRKIGLKTVELASFLGRTPRELRAALDRAGLECRSAHISPIPRPNEPSLSSDLDSLAEAAHVIGVKYVIAPTFMIPDHVGPPGATESFATYFVRAGKSMTAADWQANARFLNEKGTQLRKAGLQLGYHNHNFEFAPLGATNGMEILLSETDPAQVCFELDAGWVAAAGRDPLEIITRHPGRFKLMHVKDIKASTQPNTELRQDPTEVGSGIIPWARILPAAVAAGIRQFYIEQEPPFNGSRLDSVRKSFDYLSTLTTSPSPAGVRSSRG
jgi:sugar phosphate isomerase/epimerase